LARKVKAKARFKKEAPHIKRLRTRIKNLESKLAESVPKAVKTDLEAKIAGLESKLAESVPKSQAEALKDRLMETESKLSECGAELATTKARVKELELAIAKPTAEETPSEAPTA